MANRYLRQFMYSAEIMPVNLMGSFTQNGSTGTFATLTDNGITWTAIRMGSAGNDITVALIAGGTAGSEVVTVTDKAISVQIEDGVSTRTQVETAVNTSPAALALIAISVASGSTAATLLSPTHLATGTDTVFITNAKNFTMAQIDTGTFEIQLQDKYNQLLYVDCSLQVTSPADLITQFQSESVSSSKTIVVRVQSSASPTDMADTDVMYVDIKLRNSTN